MAQIIVMEVFRARRSTTGVQRTGLDRKVSSVVNCLLLVTSKSDSGYSFRASGI